MAIILCASPAAPPWSLLCALGALAVAALCGAWRALDRFWLRPRRLGRALRSQGLPGTAYRFPSGDMREFLRVAAAANSEPIPLAASHAVAPRALPFDHSITRQHGNLAVTWYGPEPRVIMNDPKLMREILANKHGVFGKQKSVLWVERLLANGLTTHQGEKWATHRRIINNAFHLEKLKRMLPAFAACCSELIRRWENSVGSKGMQEIDVWPEFQNLTGDVISRAAFGSSLSEGRRIFQLQSEQAQNAVNMANRMHIPAYRFLPTKLNKRMKENAREVETLLKGIISKRERAMKDGLDNDDLLGLLLESNTKETQESGSTKAVMSTEDMIGELKLFYFAGMETTAVLLTWTMVLLSMHPEWQDRAREEVLRIFGKNQPDSDGMNQLKSVTMILHEVLRLYPPILLLGRETYQETELGGVRYPPGVVFSLPIVCIHHNQGVWGEDADEFRPERFAEGVSKASKDAPAFFPFGWGPRICVGQNFALLEAKMGLAMILQHFLFELSPSYTHAPCAVSTLQPQYGAQIKLKKL
ncbi:cytochrome P450 CYP72A616-like [Miscanthus floridulus]|uniref:cytochrome P450 CYP72A616-like n=1 Tax=Miscanthus floridulus TaxID=154761 RepID=UPI00345B2B81